MNNWRIYRNGKMRYIHNILREIIVLFVDCQYVKKLLLNIWKQNVLLFHDFISFHQLICWTSYPKATNPLRLVSYLKHDNGGHIGV